MPAEPQEGGQSHGRREWRIFISRLVHGHSWVGPDPVNTPSLLRPSSSSCQRYTSHTLYLKLILVCCCYSIFVFMCAALGRCSFMWNCSNISALPQHEAKHYEWLPVCLALVPLTSLRCQQVSLNLRSFLHTQTHTTYRHALHGKPFPHTYIHTYMHKLLCKHFWYICFCLSQQCVRGAAAKGLLKHFSFLSTLLEYFWMIMGNTVKILKKNVFCRICHSSFVLGVCVVTFLTAEMVIFGDVYGELCQDAAID